MSDSSRMFILGKRHWIFFSPVARTLLLNGLGYRRSYNIIPPFGFRTRTISSATLLAIESLRMDEKTVKAKTKSKLSSSKGITSALEIRSRMAGRVRLASPIRSSRRSIPHRRSHVAPISCSIFKTRPLPHPTSKISRPPRGQNPSRVKCCLSTFRRSVSMRRFPTFSCDQSDKWRLCR